VWDCGIVPGLSILIAACPDMGIRKEALQVLSKLCRGEMGRGIL
jgi:hypothetical protein